MRKILFVFGLLLIIMLCGCSNGTTDPAETNGQEIADVSETHPVPEESNPIQSDPETEGTTVVKDPRVETEISETSSEKDHLVTEGQPTIQPLPEETQNTKNNENSTLPIIELTDYEETTNSLYGKDGPDVDKSADTISSPVTSQTDHDLSDTTAQQANEILPDETTQTATEIPYFGPPDTETSEEAKDNEDSMMTDF